MRKQSKVVLWSLGSIALLAAIVLFPISLFFGSNLIAGLISLVFERRPSRDEIVGSYTYKASWGTALLALEQSGRLQERLINKDGKVLEVIGTW